MLFVSMLTVSMWPEVDTFSQVGVLQMGVLTSQDVIREVASDARASDAAIWL